MNLKIEEVGDLSGEFIATFSDSDTLYKLSIDIDKIDKVSFMLAATWMQYYKPEKMELHINFDYNGLPLDVSRKIYENLVSNGWSEYN